MKAKITASINRVEFVELFINRSLPNTSVYISWIKFNSETGSGASFSRSRQRREKRHNGLKGLFHETEMNYNLYKSKEPMRR